jgi:ribonuclease D
VPDVDEKPVEDPPLAPVIIALTEPRDGIPPITSTAGELEILAARLASGTGPIAIDAERASGYRYGQRAYLLQFRREGSGSALVDPIHLTDFSGLLRSIGDAEWILHAASQDLPCLAELGLRPKYLFDTELAARLVGRARVGLGPLVEDVLGLGLEKGHAAADWSTRPLPEPWLRYAALDVEVLLELRAALVDELAAAGKTEWAAQEFAAIVAADPRAPRVDPWRRTSGLHRVRNRRALAIVQSMWEARDVVARERDTAPGRVLADAAIVSAALAKPTTRSALSELPEFSGRGAQRRLGIWWSAVAAGLAVPDAELPAAALATEGPPPPRSWPDRDPVAASRLHRARAGLTKLAVELSVPLENLLSPDAVRRLAWTPPEPLDRDVVRDRLVELGARPWQLDLTVDVLTGALANEVTEEVTVPS